MRWPWQRKPLPEIEPLPPKQNEWVDGFKAGFRVGFDQAFTLAYDQIRKSYQLSHDEIKQVALDEFLENFKAGKHAH